MTKRRRPKKREPWPAFTLLTAVLTVAAVLAGLLLDYISAQRGETAFLFTAAPKASAGAVEKRPPEKPAERPAEKPAPKPVVRAFDAVMQTRPEFANRISYVIAPDGQLWATWTQCSTEVASG